MNTTVIQQFCKEIRMNKPFKNRITLEDKKTIQKLRSTYFELQSPTNLTENGFWAITLQPNTYVDDISLETTFKHIIAKYYRWKYGSKYLKKKQLQIPWEGIIEQQSGYHYHIHLVIYSCDMIELSTFLYYIWTYFKFYYPKASKRFKQVYELTGWIDYISPFHSSKDNFIKKRRTDYPKYISSDLFQGSYKKK